MSLARRSFMIGSVATALVSLNCRSTANPLVKSECNHPTGGDIEGPFFRSSAPERSNLRLGHEVELLDLCGSVTDASSCAPITNARVNIWHAGEHGEYDLTNELSYHGYLNTNKDGYYKFETCVPSPYTDGGLDRPAHIHFKVSAEGYHPVTTQMYFVGDPRLKSDRFVLEYGGMDRVMMPVWVSSKLRRVAFPVRLRPIQA